MAKYAMCAHSNGLNEALRRFLNWVRDQRAIALRLLHKTYNKIKSAMIYQILTNNFCLSIGVENTDTSTSHDFRIINSNIKINRKYTHRKVFHYHKIIVMTRFRLLYFGLFAFCA